MKHIIRLVIYFIGLFILSIGIALAIKSNLGVSPISSFPLSISNATGVSLGTVTVGVYACFILTQILILRRSFKLKNLLQALFMFVFGFFVDFSASLLNWIEPGSYLMQILVMILGIIAMSIGVMLYIEMDIMPNAPEGLMLVICDKTGIAFPKMKMLFDCASVVLAAILSLAFSGNISSIREGTIISALLIGKVIAIISKPCTPWLKKIAFYDNTNLSKEFAAEVAAD